MSAANNRNRSDSDTKGSSRPGRRGKIPILVSVSLCNLCPLSKEELQVQSKSKKWFRPEHATSLLNQVRLDIVIAPPPSPPDTDADKGEKNKEKTSSETTDGAEEKVIYSSLAPVKTIHPSWNHLDETIEDYLKLDGYLDSETGFYRFMRLRIWVVSEHDSDERIGSSGKEVSGKNQSQVEETPRAKEQPLLDISIHPTQLQRLAKTPEQLPINSLILHFSDGSVRATKFLHEIVGDQDGGQSDENLKDEFGRFGDDVFRTLDSVTPVKKASNSKNNHVPDTTDPSILSSYSEDSHDGPSATLFGSKQHRKEDGGEKQRQELLSGMHDRFAWKETDATLQDVCTEQKELERLIQLEEVALQEEVQSLQQEKHDLHTLMAKATGIEASVALLDDVVHDEMLLCRKSEFFLEARRVKLLRDLRNIYPISIAQGEERYSIRDLRIPADIHAGGVAEDELSAALGFLCHLVSLISKYTSCQLRYRVVYNASRSAIQDDGGDIFPLFQARAVERGQLDYGVLLLRRNVECILKTGDIEYQSQEHLLVKAKRIFDTIVDGID